MFQHGEYVRQIGTGKKYRIVRTPGMARMMDQVSGEWVGCYIYMNGNDPFSYVRPKDDFEGKFESVTDHRAWQRGQNLHRFLPEGIHMICKKCLIDKPPSEYHKRGDTLRQVCKPCDTAQRQARKAKVMAGEVDPTQSDGPTRMEIAKELGITESMVWRDEKRALRKMRMYLEAIGLGVGDLR